MKFCPQCGTAIEPDARFCLECGYDTLTVESLNTSAPGAFASESIKSPVALEEVPSPQPEKEPACPQCGTVLIPGDRFCLQCGFDTSQIKPVVEEVTQPIQSPVVEEAIKPISPVLEPVPVQNKFCPQCGTSLDPDERFCLQCGFDTSSDLSGRNLNFRPVDQPEEIHKQEPVKSPSITGSMPPPPPVKRQEPVTPPSPQEPVRNPSPPYMPPVRTQEPVAQRKSKKTGLWILLIVIGIGALGAAGWFVYNSYLNTPDETPVDTIATTIIPDLAPVDTGAMNTEVPEQPAQGSPEPPKTNAKTLSRMDQELAKQKTKQQSKPAQQASTPTQATKPDLGVKVSPNPNGMDKLAKVIVEVGRKEDPRSKNPKNPTKFSIQKPTMIVRITTDHYNSGMGTSGGGTISIKDRDGNVIGSFRAYGKSGKDGTPNAKWVAEPHKKLDKGTYFIWDSDATTWSKNFVGTGFVVVEGYEIE